MMHLYRDKIVDYPHLGMFKGCHSRRQYWWAITVSKYGEAYYSKGFVGKHCESASNNHERSYLVPFNRK